MTIRRVTAREFQKRFQRYEEPVLVNDGVFFPKITVDLHDIAVTMSPSLQSEASDGLPPTAPTSAKRSSVKDGDPGAHGREPRIPGPKKDLSKKAQAKGKMRG